MSFALSSVNKNRTTERKRQMTNEEHDTYMKLLDLIISQGAASKTIADELNLLAAMREAYIKENQL